MAIRTVPFASVPAPASLRTRLSTWFDRERVLGPAFVTPAVLLLLLLVAYPFFMALYFSLSDDLVHWSMRQLLLQIPSATSHVCGGPDSGSYPALIDPGATDPNFRVTDDTAYLYYSLQRYNDACQPTQDIDLERVPVQFSP